MVWNFLPNSAHPSNDSADPPSAVDERLPIGRTILLGAQHVLIMYAGVVVVPILVSSGLGLSGEATAQLVSIDLVLAGIGTLLQSLGCWKFGIRMPLVVGAASNGIVPMILIGQEKGLGTVYGSLLVVGILWILVAPLFCRALRYFPNVVTGTVIALIGLTLIPVGLKMVAGPDPSKSSYGDMKSIALAAFTCLLIAVFYRVFRGLLNQLSILIALAIGSIIGWSTGMSSLKDVGKGPTIAFVEPFHFGALKFDIPSILLFFVIALVLMVEGSGQGLAVGQVVGKESKPKDIANLLRVDGLLTAVSGIFNGFAYTTFGQNIGLIALTRVRSRYPVAAGGVILIGLGIFRPFGEVMAAIPQPVIGAAAIVTFSALAVSGIQLLSTVDFSRPSNLTIVMLSLGFGLVPAGAPKFYTQFPDWAQIFLNSGVATGTAIAVLLNLIFHELGTPHDGDDGQADSSRVPRRSEVETHETSGAASPDPVRLRAPGGLGTS